MSLSITFRKTKGTDAIKDHVEKRVEKFEKFVTYPMEIHVFLTVEKAYQTAEITCHAEHRQLVAVAKSKDMYESIDLASHKIEAQLKKEREKRKGHGSAHLAIRPKALRLAGDVTESLPHREKKISDRSSRD